MASAHLHACRTHSTDIRARFGCVLLVALLVGIALVRPMFGVAVLHHDHHDLGAHTHCIRVAALADGHATGWHGHDHADLELPVESACSPLCLESGCGLMSLVFESYVPPPTAGRLPDGLMRSLPADACSGTIELRCVDPEPRSLGKTFVSAPRHLCALSARDRLIGTSMALLI